MNVDVLLIRANYEGIYTSFKTGAKVQTLTPPTSLMYVASGLERVGLKPEILDLQLERWDNKQLKEYLMKVDTKIIAATTTTPEIWESIQLLKFIKKVRPDVTLILGGPHPTMLPDDAISYDCVDIIYKGEGELEFPKVVEALQEGQDLKDVRGISYKEKGKIIHNPPAAMIDLDEVPHQAWHLIKYKEYLWPAKDRGLIPGGALVTSRGCPYRCIFCGRLFGKTIRFRSADSVIKELKFIIENYNIRFLMVMDETFTLNRKRVIEICKRIISEKIDFTWQASTRGNIYDREMFELMRKAGCNRLTIGVESGNQKILDILHKDVTLKQFEENYKLAKEVGFETRGSFIIGNPYDTRETIQETIDFAKKLHLDEAFFNIMTPYPGTELYDMAKRGEGLRIVDHDWRNYRRWGNAVIELDGLSPQDLVKLQKSAHRQFYFRFKPILHQFRRMGLVDTVKAGIKYITAFF